MSTCLSTICMSWSALSNNRLYTDFVLCCHNTLTLHLSVKIFNTFKHFLWKGDTRSLCGTDSDAKLKIKSLLKFVAYPVDRKVYKFYLSI
jgi:hypothetical protein